MKKKDIIEFEVDKMEFGGTSVSMYGNREIHMKGGITGQKVKAAVKRTRSGKADVKMLELIIINMNSHSLKGRSLKF